MLNTIINGLCAKKAENVTLYENIRNEKNVYIAASCLSNRHTKSIAEHIIQEIKHDHDYIIEGLPEGNWVLIDINNEVVIHIFQESVRSYYEVDKLWESLGQKKDRLMKTVFDNTNKITSV
ncbi:MAG: ribosome silencing factor [Rickettsiaceae bacterium H1]|nr:ribosome silencing factor [Rickettsiaceae bacterium H1]